MVKGVALTAEKAQRSRSAAPGPQFTELLPGHVALGAAGDQFKTLLGSCVSVILTDPSRTLGAMCHIVHVGEPQPWESDNTAYGRVAMNEMYRLLRSVSLVPQMCDAFVYGGGNMFPNLVQTETVGDKNVRWVLDFLQGQGIRVTDLAVSGSGYRIVNWQVGRTLPNVQLVPVETD